MIVITAAATLGAQAPGATSLTGTWTGGFVIQGVIQFELKLVDGHLKGTAKAEQGGQKLSAVVDVQRGK